jgi:hypothetical protein
MSPSLVDAESVLAIDIGSIHTRALLFDIVDGQYRFIGANWAASTASAPYYDISEGIHQAILQLQEVTGRIFIEEEKLVLPGRADGIGVDQLVITFSAGPPLKMVVLGLLEEVSLESARHLASSAQVQVPEVIGLNDRRKQETQIDAIIQAEPDIILIAGGTDHGATRSVAKIVDLVSMALQILPRDKRPEVIFAGNQSLVKNVTELLNKYTEVHQAPNIRPSVEVEHLDPAQSVLADITRHVRTRQLGGLQSYASICAVEPVPVSVAMGRLIRFLSKINNPNKGVLGLNVGGRDTIVASAKSGQLDLSTISAGLGGGLSKALDQIPIANISRWLPVHIPENEVKDYLYQKTLNPAGIPATQETLAIEQAASREILMAALRNHGEKYPQAPLVFEPILATGLILSQASPGQSLMLLLDAIQPIGVTTFVLDPYGLAPALGAIAPANSLLPVQVVESNAFLNLGTVIVPVCNARYGTPILRVRVEYDAGEDVSLEVRQGGINVLPIQPGQAARVHLNPLRPLEIEPNHREAARSYKIIGGACGAVIDARGRPLVLPADESRRRDLLKKWLLALNR